MKEFHEFVSLQKTRGLISEFCSSKGIEWRFIPEHGPHFGGLWEAAVKSTKTHLRRIVCSVKLTYEEFATILIQVEACLNSRPLVYLDTSDDDGIEALHFLIGRPLCSLPDPSFSYHSLTLQHCWNLCQTLNSHFWNRWSSDYLSLNHYSKWYKEVKNLEVGDIVVIKEDNLLSAQWPLARVTEIYPGEDGLVRVVSVRTNKGVYKRPVSKLALLLPANEF